MKEKIPLVKAMWRWEHIISKFWEEIIIYFTFILYDTNYIENGIQTVLLLLCIFTAIGTRTHLLSQCLGTAISSSSTILAFRHNVTLLPS
jgi:hypothetical protein